MRRDDSLGGSGSSTAAVASCFVGPQRRATTSAAKPADAKSAPIVKMM
jgi:hypothetical protein